MEKMTTLNLQILFPRLEFSMEIKGNDFLIVLGFQESPKIFLHHSLAHFAQQTFSSSYAIKHRENHHKHFTKCGFREFQATNHTIINTPRKATTGI